MKQRQIGFLAFDGVQGLDLIGPADAFASDAFHELYPKRPPYKVVVVGLSSRRFHSSAGVEMRAHITVRDHVELDTLIVPGGAGLRKPGVAEKAAPWIRANEPRIRRIASVCTGLYGLAPTGLLDHHEVTTHWGAIADIKRRFPRLDVNPDPIYIRSGKYYTSAGVTAGIDLALALIEDDLGAEAALAVAREMVVFYKRREANGSFPSHSDSRSTAPTDSRSSAPGFTPISTRISPSTNSPREPSSACGTSRALSGKNSA
jgi:transcriptional regulator GlxA family with amidase domain